MNLIKTLSPFFCLGFIFQLTNLKLTDLEKKNGPFRLQIITWRERDWGEF